MSPPCSNGPRRTPPRFHRSFHMHALAHSRTPTCSGRRSPHTSSTRVGREEGCEETGRRCGTNRDGGETCGGVGGVQLLSAKVQTRTDESVLPMHTAVRKGRYCAGSFGRRRRSVVWVCARACVFFSAVCVFCCCMSCVVVACRVVRARHLASMTIQTIQSQLPPFGSGSHE